MIKILFFIDDLEGGGAEKVLRTLVNNLDREQFSITVQTLNEADPTGLLEPHIRYRAINRCRTKWGKKLFSLWLRLCAETGWLYPLYIRDDYDIEVAYLECGPTKMLAGSTNRNALRLAWVHCDLAKKEGMVARTEKLKKYYAAYDKVVCVSQNVRDSFARQFGMDAQVLYNVNDETDILHRSAAFTPPPSPCPRLVSVGRLTWQKGYDRLLDACAMLKEEGYGFSLDILGEGPDRAVLEAQIQRLGLGDSVHLPGFQPNPYPYMKNGDILVCASRYEGFSTVVTEALILGKCVLTTPCSGMDELLGDSEYGLITADSVEGIHQGLKRLLDDPELRQHYARAAGERGKDFSKETVLTRTEEFFCRELEEKRRSNQ